MRNLFLACYNKYKSQCETTIDHEEGVKWLKFSPRLYEVKLAHRLESVAYVEDANIFVITEGDTARRLNFHTGKQLAYGGTRAPPPSALSVGLLSVCLYSPCGYACVCVYVCVLACVCVIL